MLLGINLLPVRVYIRGKEVSLGDLVRRSFADSRMTAAEWNDQTELERDLRLVNTYYAMREEK